MACDTRTETPVTAFSSWVHTPGKDGLAGLNGMTVWAPVAPERPSMPREAEKWPPALGRIDLYEAPRKRFCMMLFFGKEAELPKNQKLDAPGGKERWLYVHAPIACLGPALTLLQSGRQICLYHNPDNGMAALDSRTEAPVGGGASQGG